MSYMKLISRGVKHHLSAAYESSGESTTLCGCIVTRPHSWKRIGTLEGDECEQCAALAFSLHSAVLPRPDSVPR